MQWGRDRLVDLGHLLVRDDDGHAHEMFRGLLDALQSQMDMTIADRRVDLADLVTEQDRPEGERWMRLVLLVDGTKALARAGRWTEALQHVHQYRQLGGRLFDGR